MIIFKKQSYLQHYLSPQKEAGKPVGFIPTMGALHDGHISLIRKAQEDKCVVVCSIFVNPTQFNDKKDFEKYPSSIEADITLLTETGCDVLFLPSVAEVYPNGTEGAKTYDFGYLDTILEGAHRPGHFRGVGQVVARLLEIVAPSRLYMGQKDYQQCQVIKRLLALTGMEAQVQMIVGATTREADGLAMSSRNRRLTEPQRALAGIIYQCLVSIESKQHTNPFAIVQKECTELLTAKGFVPDYVALADARDLTLIENYNPDNPMVALIAAKLGEIRLIDNLLINQ